MNKKIIIISVGSIVAAVLVLAGGYLIYKKVVFPKASLETLVKQGDASKNSGNYADAEQKYQSAIQLYGDNKEAQLNLGAVYLSQQKYTEAKDVLQKAYDAGSTDSLALNNLGNAYRNSGDNEKAIVYYKLAVEKGNLDSLKNLVTILNIQGNFDQSITYLKKAIADNPKDDSLQKLLDSTEYKKSGS